MIKAAVLGNLQDAHIPACQQIAAYFQPVPVQKFNGRLLCIFFKYLAALVAAYIPCIRDMGQADFPGIILIDEGNHILTDDRIGILFRRGNGVPDGRVTD